MDKDGAQALMSHMRRSGLQPAHAHYNAFLMCANPRAEGRAALETMRSKGIAIDEETIRCALHGAVRHHAWGHFGEYLQWLDDYGLAPDPMFYSRLLTLLAETHNLPPAEHVLQDARKRGLAMDAVMFSAMLSLNHAHRRFARVVELYDEFVQGPIALTVKTFSAAIHALQGSARTRDAERIFSDIPRFRLPVQVPHYTALMNVYASAGRLDQVLRVFDDIEREHRLPDLVTFVTILRACASAGDVERATHIWRLMQDKYHIAADEPAWNAYIKAHAAGSEDAGGGMAKVRELTLAMRQADVPVTSFYFNHLMDVFAGAGKVADCMQLAAKLQELGLKPTYETYLHQLRACRAAGDVGAAKRVLAQFVQSRSAKISRDDRIFTLYLQLLAEHGLADDILATTEKMLDMWVLFHPDTFVPVLTALVGKGQLATAANVLTVDMQRHFAPYDARHLSIVLDGLIAALPRGDATTQAQSQARAVATGMGVANATGHKQDAQQVAEQRKQRKARPAGGSKSQKQEQGQEQQEGLLQTVVSLSRVWLEESKPEEGAQHDIPDLDAAVARLNALLATVSG